MQDILRIVGTVAGVGGIALGIVLLIYRDFVRDFIQARVFKTLSSQQATLLFSSIIGLTFCLAVLGLYVGFVRDSGSNSFILLVVVVLVFMLLVLYIFRGSIIDDDKESEQQRPEKGSFEKINELIKNRQFDDAERELSRLVNTHHKSAEYWFWKAQVGFERGNSSVAKSYIDEALKWEPKHPASLAFKIKLLLISGKKSDVDTALEIVTNNRGISPKLDSWMTCLLAEGVFSVGAKSNHELDAKCRFE